MCCDFWFYFRPWLDRNYSADHFINNSIFNTSAVNYRSNKASSSSLAKQGPGHVYSTCTYKITVVLSHSASHELKTLRVISVSLLPHLHRFMKSNSAIQTCERLYSRAANCQLWMWLKRMWVHPLYKEAHDNTLWVCVGGQLPPSFSCTLSEHGLSLLATTPKKIYSFDHF